jgi:cytochrome c oxidase subunit 4
VSDAHDDLNITNPEHAEHHIVTPMNYLFVYIALIVGTILTVVFADIDLGVLNPIIALGLACTKACIVPRQLAQPPGRLRGDSQPVLFVVPRAG